MIKLTIVVDVTLVFAKGVNKSQLCLDGNQLAIRKKWSAIAVDLEQKALRKYWCITWTAISTIQNFAI
jgi:hypothetical protein